MKRASRKGPMTAEEFVEYMTVKTIEHLAKMPPAEKKARLAAARRASTPAR